ncbi:hypothetical protein F4808DRAFT_464319 [Astrocystis sublimbata]|nr:hypothetical protein F4808DRAFT_464319 [Astrocystis sublimbata]
MHQHELFAGGLKSLNQYATNTTAVDCKGKEVCELIETFAQHMVMHLADEIDTLWVLDCCGKVYQDPEAEAGKQDKTAVPPMALGLCDKTFEGGNNWHLESSTG